MTLKNSVAGIALAVGAAMVAPSMPVLAGGNSAQDIEAVRDSYICVFDKSVAKSDVRGKADKMVGEAGGTRGHVYTTAIRGFSTKMPAHALENMKANNPNIAYCEADQVATAYFLGKPGGGTTQPAQTTPWGISRVGGPRNGSGKTAWVIDTGIDLDHPDLNVDVARSVSFITKGKVTPEDGNGHGTHVAGTIAALDNNIGVVGVAPGATVVAVRVLDSRGSGSNSGVIAGIDYVAANAAPGDVANMSLGGGVSQALDDAVRAAADNGILFALAAGNETDDANNHSPARVEYPNVWTVSAIDSSDAFAYFSNFGNPPIECAAPGVSIQSTWLNGGYNTISGTSMATPHVAGLLLFGAPNFSGTATGDPDGDADNICSF